MARLQDQKSMKTLWLTFVLIFSNAVHGQAVMNSASSRPNPEFGPYQGDCLSYDSRIKIVYLSLGSDNFAVATLIDSNDGLVLGFEGASIPAQLGTDHAHLQGLFFPEDRNVDFTRTEFYQSLSITNVERLNSQDRELLTLLQQEGSFLGQFKCTYSQMQRL